MQKLGPAIIYMQETTYPMMLCEQGKTRVLSSLSLVRDV